MPKIIQFALAATVVLAVAGTIDAQPPTPGVSTYRSPAVSPFLNLNRTGAPPALNYYDLVRPQFQTDQAVQGLTYDVNQNRQAIMNGTASGNLLLPPTGHPTQFLNLGGYFLNSTGAAQSQNGLSGPLPNSSGTSGVNYAGLNSGGLNTPGFQRR